MSAQQKYLYQYAYLDGSSFNAIENNNLYNDNRGGAGVLQNYNHNSLVLKFKAGECTARALSVLLANSQVGLILQPITHDEIVTGTVDVYDLVKVGNINLSPNIHFYEVGSEFLSNQINNVDFLTAEALIGVIVTPGDVEIDDGTNTYIIPASTLTHGISSFYVATGNAEGEGDPVALVDLRNMTNISMKFGSNSIPDNFLSEFANTSCVLTIENAMEIMEIGDNVFANSEFSNIIAEFSGIRELGSGVNLAKSGATVTAANPLGLEPYAGLSLSLTNDIKEIDSLLIASNFFASGSKRLLNDTCNALSFFQGNLSEIKNCTIVEDFADLTNLNQANVVFEGCDFEVDQDFSGNPESREVIIRNCNQENTGSQTFIFTGFGGSINIENSFKSIEAIYTVDDAAAYALIIDNLSFINAGINSGSLNKVLTNENRDLPELLVAGAFLQVNEDNIVSFSGNSFQTVAGDILIIDKITSLEFSEYQKWDLANGDFSFMNFDLISPLSLYLFDDSTKISYINNFAANSFYNIARNSALTHRIYILASQILEILSSTNCFTSSSVWDIYIYNDLPEGFNYLLFARNETSFILDKTSGITCYGDNSGLMKIAIQYAYPEYAY